ncbi:hypothetical protein [Rhodococcus sp. IEGM 1307]|uniref:hypothetical protein n=1 Tax=Rhodococcus sp. IEGM 1307 TaxID=3047091 RepID=UPI0024B827A6|nr:hypothetical protein [Rhodococcus sp. IEGM 1307]MDI9979426.1 hypothetical protein [Rhodococcus sp. IEGM 1307]
MWTADSFQRDVSAGTWVDESLKRFAIDHRAGLVGQVVPPEFDAYARIFHPAHRRTGPSAGQREPITWHAVAAANERTAHPLMEWEFLLPTPAARKGQPGLWDEAPIPGELTGPTAEALIGVLANFTTTPDQCWYAIWEGSTLLDDVRENAGLLQAGNMAMFLLTDSITAAGTQFRNLLSPNLWWPDDRAWCVATDIDLMASYVGASTECVHAITNCSDLEALEVSATMSVQWDSDTINPRPDNRS